MNCIGIYETAGKCQNPAGSTHSVVWCQECCQKRRDKISKNLDLMLETFDHKNCYCQKCKELYSNE